MDFIITQVDNEHERRFRVNLSGGRHVVVYVRHPILRTSTIPQETHRIHVTRLQDVALTYADWQKLQAAINFISISVEETKPGFEKIMADPERAITNVYS